MPPPKLLPTLQQAPTNPGPLRPDPNAKDRPDLLSVPMDVIWGLLGMDANSTGRMQNGKASLLSTPNAAAQALSAGLPILGGSKLLYSRLDRAVEGLPEVAHPNKVFSLLKSNASAEEMKLRNIDQFISSQRGQISKAALQQHLKENPLPKVTKSVLGEGQPGQYAGKPQYPSERLAAPGQKTEYNENLYNLGHSKQFPEKFDAPHFSDANLGNIQGDENLLMHSRTTERDLPGEGRILFGEEDQSDWHQQGRKKGYQGSDDMAKVKELDAKYWAVREQQNQLAMQHAKEHGDTLNVYNTDDPRAVAWQQLNDEANRIKLEQMEYAGSLMTKPPQGPYAQEWPNILMKDQIGQAVEDPSIKGYGWTTGDIQNKRNNLSEVADKLQYIPEYNRLRVYKSGSLEREIEVTPDKLPDWIGEEATQRLLATPAQNLEFEEYNYNGGPSDRLTYKAHNLDTANLEIGGKGMREFYDKRKVNAVQKLLRPYGGTVEEKTLRGIPEYDRYRPTSDSTGVRDFDYNINNDPNAVTTSENIASLWPREAPALNSPAYNFESDVSPAELHQYDRAEMLSRTIAEQRTPQFKIWYAALTPEIKAQIKKNGIPFLMTLWAAHKAGQQNPNAIPAPPATMGANQ